MRSQEWMLKGKLWIQVLQQLPAWVPEDCGRIVFILSKDNAYLGTSHGWEPYGLFERCIKNRFVDWDDQLLGTDDKISAKNIPIKFEDVNDNIQHSMDLVSLYFANLRDGKDFHTAAIKAKSIDLASKDGVTADKIMVRDVPGCFSSTAFKYSIEDALNQLCQRRADGIKLSKTSAFGSIIALENSTVQSALEELEEYVSDLKASQIDCNFWAFTANEGSCYEMTLQQALNKIYSKFSNLKIEELVDVQKNYGQCGQVLKSCGEVPYACRDFTTNVNAHWGNVKADEVAFTFINSKGNSCGVPYETTVQYAVDWIINNDVRGLPIGYVTISPMGIVKCGFLPCLGGLYYKEDYPDLFNEIGYYFGGSGDQFAVPNYYDIHLRGTRSGRAYHSYEPDGVGDHAHAIDMGYQPVAQGGEWAWGDRQFSPLYAYTLHAGGSENTVRNRSVLYVIRAY